MNDPQPTPPELRAVPLRWLWIGGATVLVILAIFLWARQLGWMTLDTWIVVTAAMASMACALPGVFLVIRRQSMMGDALSHTALPGVVIAFLLAHALERSGWISPTEYESWRHAIMFTGALVLGILSAVLTEWVQKLGRVESSAALGVVFTSLFAFGLLLIRLKADSIHIDPDCVLYGTIETVVLDELDSLRIPRAAAVNGGVLLVNLALVLIFFKELRISAFDPALATSMGINANVMHYALTAATAATLVAAFESVGSILVIAMLIAPAAAAHLLTDRLTWLIGLSLLIAAISAGLGHVLAIGLPALIFPPLGFDRVGDASTAGMMAVAAGLCFVLAALLGPRHGIVMKSLDRLRLGVAIAAEDVLGILYRSEERDISQQVVAPNVLAGIIGESRLTMSLAVRRLVSAGEITLSAEGYQLTAAGRQRANELVRSHRLFESYMAKHFELPEDHLHDAAERAEHFIDREMRDQLAAELKDAPEDPHGRAIPPEDSH